MMKELRFWDHQVQHSTLDEERFYSPVSTAEACRGAAISIPPPRYPSIPPGFCGPPDWLHPKPMEDDRRRRARRWMETLAKDVDKSF